MSSSTATGADGHAPASAPDPGRRVLRAAIWLPGLAVALGAAVATAHGLYEVAVAARVPAGIAWLYPLITDGLALVAYAATARLDAAGRRYAWAVVILAAGLSGLAQAAFLATDAPAPGPGGGSGFVAPPALRFGVGAWPAVAAAIVAHLLYLLATEHPDGRGAAADGRRSSEPVQRPVFTGAVHPLHAGRAEPRLNGTPRPNPPVQPARTVEAPVQTSARPGEAPTPRSSPSPARDRALSAARRHVAGHGALPTVTELEAVAEVSRGTAAHVLKQLRAHPDQAPTTQKVTRR